MYMNYDPSVCVGCQFIALCEAPPCSRTACTRHRASPAAHRSSNGALAGGGAGEGPRNPTTETTERAANWAGSPRAVAPAHLAPQDPLPAPLPACWSCPPQCCTVSICRGGPLPGLPRGARRAGAAAGPLVPLARQSPAQSCPVPPGRPRRRLLPTSRPASTSPFSIPRHNTAAGTGRHPPPALPPSLWPRLHSPPTTAGH